MSWLDNVDLPVMINTGDNKYFSVLWKPEELNIEWNIAEFEFNEKDGSLVKRGRVKGRRLPLRIFFQGDDHLDQVADFLRSTLDRRPWVISHPMYRDLIVQPISLKVNNVDYNITEITGVLVETIIDDGVIFTPDPVDKVTNDKAILDETFVSAFDVIPDATNISSMLDTNTALYTSGNKLFPSDEYFNVYKDANKAVLRSPTDPLLAMRKIQALITSPALFSQSVLSRVSLFQQQFESLRLGLSLAVDKSSKLIYQTQGASLISCMCLAAANPLPGDYKNAISITVIIEIIINNYNIYITDLDGLQSENGGEPGSFIPDVNSMIGLNGLVNYSVTSLVKIALGAKQERTIILENDSNWILLAHRFYGLDAADENIDTLMENNYASLDTLMGVRKGAKVVYYV